MDDFEPGDVVIHRRAKDRDDHGVVMEVPFSCWKRGYTAVYKNRQCWIKTENLMYLSEWDRLHLKKQKPQIQGNLKDYWVNQ